MGEVYKPEDLVGGKKKSSDLSPGLGGFNPTTFQIVVQEINLLKTEIKKIKQVLRTNGIVID